MEGPTLDTLRRSAAVAGFAWTDAELQALQPLAARMLAILAELESLPLAGVEPAVQYRIL